MWNKLLLRFRSAEAVIFKTHFNRSLYIICNFHCNGFMFVLFYLSYVWNHWNLWCFLCSAKEIKFTYCFIRFHDQNLSEETCNKRTFLTFTKDKQIQNVSIIRGRHGLLIILSCSWFLSSIVFVCVLYCKWWSQIQFPTLWTTEFLANKKPDRSITN